jgi:hypothetical protein
VRATSGSSLRLPHRYTGRHARCDNNHIAFALLNFS